MPSLNKQLIMASFRNTKQSVFIPEEFLKVLSLSGLSMQHRKLLENIFPKLSDRPYANRDLSEAITKEQVNKLALRLADTGNAELLYSDNIKITKMIYQKILDERSSMFIETAFSKSPLYGKTCSELYVAPPVIKAAFKTCEHYTAPTLSNVLSHGIIRMGHASKNNASIEDVDMSPLTNLVPSSLQKSSSNDLETSKALLLAFCHTCGITDEAKKKRLAQHLVTIPFMLQSSQYASAVQSTIEELSKTIYDQNIQILVESLLDISEILVSSPLNGKKLR